jgi:hypothetical protein
MRFSKTTWMILGLITLFAIGGSIVWITQNNAKLIPLESNEAQLITSDYASVDSTDYLYKDEYFESLPVEHLSEAERIGLIQMREEEKLAHDVYTTLYEIWEQQIFSNISDSEQTHTDMIKELLIKYEIDDPVKDNEIGEFTNAEISKLYDNLVAEGSKSVIDALRVGALIEDLDISDLNKLVLEVDNQDILTVYNNLEKGSRNHLRSYTRLLNRNGEIYTPEYISQSEYESIINSASEIGSQLDSRGNRR